jgi:hypothetical protein
MTRVTNSDSGGGGAPGSSADEQWSLTSLVRRHQRTAAAGLAVVVVLVAITIFTTISNPHRQALGNSASCSQWSAATPAQQIAYSHTYINEFGAFANTAANAAAVKARIDRACTKASYLGEADDISVIGALKKAF